MTSGILSLFITLIGLLQRNNLSTPLPLKENTFLSVHVPNKHAQFLVNTPGCKIPDLDPFDASIRQLVMVKSKEIHCNATPAITFVDGDFLRINRTALKLYYEEDLENCLYQTILRSTENTDDRYSYGNVTRWFSDDTAIKDDFIRVACYGTQGSLLYANFHAFIHKKPSVEKRCRKANRRSRRQRHLKENLNLIIVGVDSVSRLNFMRQMSDTRRFLLHNLSAIELKGYNKVADNTYVNLVPMFAGKFVEELPWDESMTQPFDDYQFIWKNFSARGYRTLYAEDAPKIAIFNYAKEGFYKAPSDYYLRPFSLAMEDHGSIWNTHHDCVGPRLETEIVLDYTMSFLDKFQRDPYYAFSFITRLTHDGINKVGAADKPYYKFLTHLQAKRHLDNSVLIFFSDHGMRFGSIRQTYVGKLEERLPFMFLVFPKWFHTKYPLLSKNLRINTRRLTTPFDIYETLKDILHFTGRFPLKSPVSQRGISLFSEIPEERTCDHAGILEHWCTCHEQQQVDTNSSEVLSAANFVIGLINKIVMIHKGLCAELFVKSVTDARKVIPSDQVLRFQESLHDVIGRKVTFGKRTTPSVDYMLTFRTTPGDGLFEVTVRYTQQTAEYKVIGDISRINAYGDSATCIQFHGHMKFCYCQ